MYYTCILCTVLNINQLLKSRDYNHFSVKMNLLSEVNLIFIANYITIEFPSIPKHVDHKNNDHQRSVN